MALRLEPIIKEKAKAELALRLEDVIKARAKENLKTSTGGSSPRPFLNSKKAEKINTHKELAKIAGVGADTIWKTNY